MKLKERPEDFFVKEIKVVGKSEEGTYLYFLLQKKERTTLEVIRALADALHIPFKQIGYAGNKDKQAVTEQYISLFKIHRSQVEKVKLRGVILTYVTHAYERISLGDLEGNFFRIVLRDFEKEEDLKIEKIKNYFDDQRFGIEGINWCVGKAIVQSNFKKACELLKLEVVKNDFVGTLRKVEKKLLLFYVHSYQSYLWNIIVASLEEEEKTVPLLGFLTEFGGKVKEKYAVLLQQEQIGQRDFLVKGMPELACEGDEREVVKVVKDFSFSWEDDEFHVGKRKVTLTFSLDAGVYATMVVKQLFGKPL